MLTCKIYLFRHQSKLKRKTSCVSTFWCLHLLLKTTKNLGGIQEILNYKSANYETVLDFILRLFLNTTCLRSRAWSPTYQGSSGCSPLTTHSISTSESSKKFNKLQIAKKATQKITDQSVTLWASTVRQKPFFADVKKKNFRYVYQKMQNGLNVCFLWKKKNFGSKEKI